MSYDQCHSKLASKILGLCPDSITTCTDSFSVATLLPPCTHHPGDKAEALDMYSRGVTELEKGINMDIRAKGTYTVVQINCYLIK